MPLPNKSNSCLLTLTCGVNNKNIIAKNVDMLLYSNTSSCSPNKTCVPNSNYSILKSTDLLLLLQTTLPKHLPRRPPTCCTIQVLRRNYYYYANVHGDPNVTGKYHRVLSYKNFVTKITRYIIALHLLPERDTDFDNSTVVADHGSWLEDSQL